MLSLEDVSVIPVDSPSGDALRIQGLTHAGAFMPRIARHENGLCAFLDTPDSSDWEDTVAEPG